MKRVFAFSIALMLIIAALGAQVSAAQTASVDIWVDIKNGGTAVIITEVNCPLPDKSSLTLDDGQSGAFHIDFSEEGVYSYTIRLEPDERDITFDDTVYLVRVYVTEENGSLYTSIVIYNKKTDSKYSPQGLDEPCTVTFVNDESPDTPDETTVPTQPTESEPPSEPGSATEQPPSGTDDGPKDGDKGSDNGDKGSGGSSRPQTGDDSRLDFYLLLALFASAGLFTLSVLYYRSVVREIKQR